MLEALKKYESLYKVTCFCVRMADKSKEDQEKARSYLESLNFENEDQFIDRIIWNVWSLYNYSFNS